MAFLELSGQIVSSGNTEDGFYVAEGHFVIHCVVKRIVDDDPSIRAVVNCDIEHFLGFCIPFILHVVNHDNVARRGID